MRNYNPVSPSKMAIGSKIELGRVIRLVLFISLFVFLVIIGVNVVLVTAISSFGRVNLQLYMCYSK